MGNRNRQPDNGRVRKPNQNGGQRPANNGGGPRGRGPRASVSARRPPPPNFQAANEHYDNHNSKPRGRGNLRGRGGSGRHGGRNRGGNHLESFAVTEWTENNCPSDGDFGAEKLVEFLSKKAHATIEEYRVEGKSLIVSVDPADGDSLLSLNGFNFWGAKLVVARIGGTIPLDKSAQCDSPNTIHTFKEIIGRRYDDERRFLDLSDLANDTLLNGLAIFGPYSIEARKASFFTAFMKTCDDIWGTEQEKEQAVVGISLANNNIGDVEYIKMLAHTFKAIKYLDLSNNCITGTENLLAWRFDFRFLEELILSGNQIEEGRPDYRSVLTRWFPSLRLLSNTPVRSAAESNTIATTGRPVQSEPPVLPVPILVASFRDEGAVGENFIKQFFPAYDMDRNACLNAFYDAKSTFSVSINTSAPRGSFDMNVGWDAQIKKSRNLIKVTQLAAKLSRLYTGAESIRNAWNTLPSTRHPDLMTEAGKWNIECNSVPGLPDPVGQSVSGVGGLIIQVHGEFAEVNFNTNQEITTRSFDRTFILGPGMGTQGVRVVCDSLILRAYGGSNAWKPQCGDLLVAHPSEAELSIQPLIPDGFGSSHPEKSQEQLQKEILTVELSRTTRMTLEWAAKCLIANNWSIEAAAADFAAVRHDLSPGFFVQHGGSLLT